MRTWEIVLVAVVTVTAVALCWSRVRRGIVGIALCLVLAVAMGAHLLLEGDRWQLAPAYLAACLAALAVVFAVVRRGRRGGRSDAAPTSSRRLSAVLRALSVTGIGLGLLTAWAIPAVSPVFVATPTTGDWKVGTVSFEVGGDSPVSAQAWYPSDAEGPQAPYSEHGDALASGLARALGMPAMLFNTVGISESTAAWDVPPAHGRHPVVLFSHGMGGFRGQSSFLVEELASHGYVVVAADYPEGAAASVTSHGTQLLELPLPSGFAQLDALMASWVDRAGQVLDALEGLDAGEGLLAGTLDLNRIAAVGHSYGGAVSYQLLAADPRIAAAVDLDGVPYGPVHPPLSKPFLLVHASKSVDRAQYDAKLDAAGITDHEPYDEIWRTQQERYASATAGSGSTAIIDGADHMTFTDFPNFSPLLAGDEPHAKQAKIRLAVLAFLGQALSP
ncbi:carboxylic ester hydrolase [Okibacterium endophyticum]